MEIDMNVPIEQTIALEKVNPITDSALPITFGSGLTMLELVNKLLRVVNESIGNDIALSKNFNSLLAAFEELRKYVQEHGFGDGSITGDVLVDYTISAIKLAAGCVTSVKIHPGAVTEDKIADGAVTSSKIADRSISDKKLAYGCVTDKHMTSNSVGTYHIKEGCINGKHLDPATELPSTIKGATVGFESVYDARNKNLLATLGTLLQFVGDYVATGKHTIGAGKFYIKEGGMTSMGGNRVQMVGDPVSDTDAVNMGTLNKRTKPLVLFAGLDLNPPAMYQDDPAYGDEALEAILTGRQILVRTPNASMLGMTNAQLVSTDHHTAIFTPVLTYQLPNYENEYLYLFYLRDEKQTIPMSGVAGGGIQLPVYGQLKLKLSTKYNQCPLEPMTTREYGSFLLGLTQS